MKIAIVGTGFIGQAWAIVFARAGYHVNLWDKNEKALAQAVPFIEEQLRTLAKQGLINEAADVILARIQSHKTLETALEDVDYVQENAPEILEIKKSLYSELDQATKPEAIIGSSTSSLPSSLFTEHLKNRERCLVVHPVNPPYLIPVVELCAAPWTSEHTINQTYMLMTQLKQKPIIVHHEPSGFILNRLQGALLREAFKLVEAGYVSVEEIDITIKDGLGLRWAFMGPFETIDLNAPEGVADYCKRYGAMFQQMSKEQTSTAPWSNELIQSIQQQRRQLLSADQLAEKRVWRDQKLMELIKHKQQNQ